MTIVNNVLNAPIPFVPAKGGTGLISPTPHGILVAQGSSPVNPIVLDAGQILVGTTSGDPAAVAITAGTGISIASTSGSIQISSAAAGFGWNTVTGTTQALVADNGYINNSGTLCVYSLPVNPSIGDAYTIYNQGGGFSVAIAGGSQTISFGASNTVALTGSVNSTAIGDVIEMICIDNTTPGSELYAILSAIGNITVA